MKCQICNKAISDFEYQSLNGECEECQELSEQQWYDYQFKNSDRKLSFDGLVKEDILREIPNTNGKYFASRSGDIFNCKGRKLKPFELKARGGYLTLGILGKTEYVHQLIARTFLGKCPQGMEINHIDCTVANNQVENLEYVTHRKNVDNVILNRSTFGAYRSSPKCKTWKTMIFVDGIEYRIGHFKAEAEAVCEYKKVFKEWYGFEPKIKARAFLKGNKDE